MDTDSEIKPQHYAFLVSEAEFDEIFGRIRQRGFSTGPIPRKHNLVKSTTTTAVVESISRIPTATSWRSLPALTEAADGIHNQR